MHNTWPSKHKVSTNHLGALAVTVVVVCPSGQQMAELSVCLNAAPLCLQDYLHQARNPSIGPASRSAYHFKFFLIPQQPSPGALTPQQELTAFTVARSHNLGLSAGAAQVHCSAADSSDAFPATPPAAQVTAHR
jgi:hypothetical protein